MPILVTEKPNQFFDVFDKNGQGYLMSAYIAQIVYSSDKLHSSLNLEA